MPPYEIWPFQPRAYLGDVGGMSPAEKWGYFALLIHYWINRRLPTDDDELRNITGLPAPAWKRSRAKIESKFEKGWRHSRVEQDLKLAAKYHGQQSAKAKRRWEKNTGDKKMSRDSSRGINKLQQFQSESIFPTHATAMPKERIDRLPSITGSTSPVEKSPPMCLAPALPNNKNRSEQRARQKWEAELRTALGYQHYSEAIEVLAREPKLVSRATLAEMGKPGAGVTTALIGLRGKLVDHRANGEDDQWNG